MTSPARLGVAVLLAAGIAAGTAACSDNTTPHSGETKSYYMAEGDEVFLDPSEPLPANVLNDIAFQAKQVLEVIPEDDQLANQGAVTGIAHVGGWAEDATGREIIIVFPYWSAPSVDGSPGPYQRVWGSTRVATQNPTPDKAARVAEVKAYIAAAEKPSEWDMVVLD